MRRPLPICTDCRHCRAGSVPEFNTCYAPQGRTTGNVLAGATGTPARWKYCSTNRDAWWLPSRLLGMCGREGRWFEPKVTP